MKLYYKVPEIFILLYLDVVLFESIYIRWPLSLK